MDGSEKDVRLPAALVLGGALVALVFAVWWQARWAPRAAARTPGAAALAAVSAPDPLVARVTGAGLSPALAQAIRQEAERHGIDPRLVLAIIEVESGWDPEARNGESVGLMQVSPAAMREMVQRGVAGGDLRDPVANVRIGTAYLAWLMRRYPGDLAMALTAYNQGPSRAERWRARTGSGESAYSRKVIAAMNG